MPNFIWCLVIVSIPIGLFVILYHYLVNMDASKSDNSDKRSKQIRTRKMGVTSPPENNSLRCRKEGVVAPSLDGLIVGQNTSTDYVRNRKLGAVTSELSSEENIEVNEISALTGDNSLRCRKEGVVAPSLDGLISGQNTSTDRPRKNGVTTRSIIETDYVRNRKLGVVTSGLGSEENIEVNEIPTVTENKSSSRGAC